MPLLEVQDLTVRFTTPAGTVHAVNGVTYSLEAGETLAVIGESASGKSVHALAMLGILPRMSNATRTGKVLFNGRDLLTLSEEEMRGIRGKEIGFVFQDPMSSLNPVLTVGRQLVDVLRQHKGLTKPQALDRAEQLLATVKIKDPRATLNRYPHQLSGGMRQRVMIAIAVSCEPKLLIADEPTTALDVTVQRQVIELIHDLKERLGMAVLWITHDMAVTAGIADTVQVMYAGRLVERGPTRSVFRDPRNAYTLGLLRSTPDPRQRHVGRLFQMHGQPPDALHPLPGDPFAPRNPFVTVRCFAEVPPLRQAKNAAPGHLVAAWYDLPAELAIRGEVLGW